MPRKESGVKSWSTYALTDTKSPIWIGSPVCRERSRIDDAAMQSDAKVVSWISSCCDELSSESDACTPTL